MPDLIVIGGGPGGYAAAIRGAQLGMAVTLIEREAVGGVCLNWGCIPSKALLRNAEVLSLVRHAGSFGIHTGPIDADFGAAIDRSRSVVQQLLSGVQGLMKTNRITVISGDAVLVGAREVRLQHHATNLTADHVLVAVGARPKLPPGIGILPGRVITSREALAERDLPRAVAIIGGGAVGSEFATIWRAYGVDVTIIETAPRLLPSEDADLGKALGKAFQGQGIRLMLESTVEAIDTSDLSVSVRLKTPKGSETLAVDKVLVAIGARPNSDHVGAQALGLTDARGFIVTDAEHRTSLPALFAVGDVTGPVMLAHVATHQGIRAVEVMAGHPVPPLDYRMMPRATYSHPEVASMGLTEEQARADGRTVSTGTFPFAANGRALALGDPGGFVKVVVDTRYNELLGVHMIGAGVSELLAEPLLATTLEATVAEIGQTVLPHPTLTEAFKEAALAALGQAIHLPPKRPQAPRSLA